MDTIRDLMTWARVTRIYMRRGWPLLKAASYARTLVYAGAYR